MADLSIAELAQRVRAELGPKPGDPDAFQRPCLDCGAPFWKRYGSHTRRCPACAYRRQVERLEAKAPGEGWSLELCVRRSLVYWRREAERLGIDPTDELPGEQESR